jgi:putative ABC transport system ATP-binding protein
MDASIQVESVVVRHTAAHGPIAALDGVSFTVDAGSSVAVVGPSGCGKSTLLGVLGGLALPTAGTVRIGGEEISALPERRRAEFRRAHVGFVYQADNLLPFLTVVENVGLQLALDAPAAGADRSLELLDRLGLAEEAHRLPDHLSGGQRQRAAVARAVVHRPEVILADEPTGALDAANAAGVIDLLLDVQRDIGATLVMVTHDEGAAGRMDRRIGLARRATGMIARYVWRDLVRNPRRSLATLAGITLGVGLFSAVLFFIDGSPASMTQRAIAPLPLDMQRVLTAPLGEQLRLTERITPAGPLQPGDTVRVELVLANNSAQPANEVVIRDEPPPPLAYVPGSTTVDGTRMPDPGGDSPLAQGAAKLGLNLGTVPPRTSVTVAYTASAGSPVDAVASLPLQATFSSREEVAPVHANAPGPAGLGELTRMIAAVPGVATADQLAFVDLAPGSLRSGSRQAAGAVRVFGFDDRYRQHDDAIRLVSGSTRPGHGLLSAEAARALGVGPGGVVGVRVPGMDRPLQVPISGITDLSRAKSLFYSREGQQLEQFLYVANAVVVEPEVFARTIVPAFQKVTAASGDEVRSRPILEVDVDVERQRLDADPGTALGRPKRSPAPSPGSRPGRTT